MVIQQLQSIRLKSDLKFVLLFVVYFTLIYGGIYAVIGLSVRGGIYSSLVADHFNFVAIYRTYILKCCSRILDIWGRRNEITYRRLHVVHGATVYLNYVCLGIGIISTWCALVLSYPSVVKWKFVYILTGLAAITFINILRIVVLASVYSSAFGARHRNIDHHFIANVFSYIVFGIVLYSWFQRVQPKVSR